MKSSKIFLSILESIIITSLGILSFELSLYLANKLYHSNYIQNIHHTADITQLSLKDILIGTDGGMLTLFIGTFAFFVIGLRIYDYIKEKINQIYKKR